MPYWGRAGDLVVVDESATTDTPALAAIHRQLDTSPRLPSGAAQLGGPIPQGRERPLQRRVAGAPIAASQMSSARPGRLSSMTGSTQTPTTLHNIGVAMFTVADQDAALAFYTEKLGFEVRGDTRFGENGEHRWLEVAPPGSRALLALNPPMGGSPVAAGSVSRRRMCSPSTGG
jgi:hypothetical protein